MGRRAVSEQSLQARGVPPGQSAYLALRPEFDPQYRNLDRRPWRYTHVILTLRETEAKELPGVQVHISVDYARPYIRRQCVVVGASWAKGGSLDQGQRREEAPSRYLVSEKSKCG